MLAEWWVMNVNVMLYGSRRLLQGQRNHWAHNTKHECKPRNEWWLYSARRLHWLEESTSWAVYKTHIRRGSDLLAQWRYDSAYPDRALSANSLGSADVHEQRGSKADYIQTICSSVDVWLLSRRIASWTANGTLGWVSVFSRSREEDFARMFKLKLSLESVR